ncbi:MAG: two-component system response regulator [Candidatus Methylomirabilota bacterium]|nr:response regulator [Candidatus Methylomirabilis sp.]NJD69382.1 response regulator [candidate division NC10 bacterium]PWB43505.1 MAG: two-component system response regulator [candidate division NC10 bacterium]
MAKRILIVDDSNSMRGFIRTALTDGGLDVIEASNGRDALTMLDRHAVDAIITDVNMPVMDGITLVKEIRRRPVNGSTPVLILTTECDAAMKQAGRAAGATGWIVKPFNPQQLRQVIAKVLPLQAG